MRISEVIIELANEIKNNGDKDLPDDFLISYKYGEIKIE